MRNFPQWQQVTTMQLHRCNESQMRVVFFYSKDSSSRTQQRLQPLPPNMLSPPFSHAHLDPKFCFWRKMDMRRETQVNLMFLIRRICRIYSAATACVQQSRGLVAIGFHDIRHRQHALQTPSVV
jgi:hypothetical protein